MALIENRIAKQSFSLRTVAQNVAKRLSVWRTRRALARLDAHLLKDVGISAEQARHEAELTVWDVPETWIRRRRMVPGRLRISDLVTNRRKSPLFPTEKP